jgi:MoaA/NifB/PqqE/SkfB family radical SAM enzyme
MSKIKKEGFYAFLNRAIRLSNLSYLIKKPLLLLRITKVAVYYTVFKKDVPWNANLALISNCNLDCQHCFAHLFNITAEGKNKKELSTTEIIGVIKESLDLGVFNFDLQGGEILLHPDLEKIIKAIEPRRSFINIVTNGTLFNKEWAIKLKNWGVDGISFSVDSCISDEHDSFRNQQGVFSKLLNAIQIAKKYKFTIIILTTVTHQTLRSEGVKRLHDFCLKNNFIHYLFIGIPAGKWLGRTDILINEDDHSYMEELAKKTNNKIRRDLSPHFFRSGCPAVKEGYYMTPYGDILPCPFLHISLGNIRNHFLKDILGRALTLKPFSDYCPVCLIGQDNDFINKYGQRLFTSAESPIDSDEILEFKTRLPLRSTSLAR